MPYIVVGVRTPRLVVVAGPATRGVSLRHSAAGPVVSGKVTKGVPGSREQVHSRSWTGASIVKSGLGLERTTVRRHAWERRLRAFLTPEILEDSLIATGAAGIGLIWLASSIVHYGFRYGYEDFIDQDALLALLTSLAFFLLRRGMPGTGWQKSDERKALVLDFKAFAIVAALVVIVGFLGKSVGKVSRGWYLSWLAGSALFLVFVRLAMDGWLLSRVRDLLAYRVALVGAPDLLQSASAYFRSRSEGIEPAVTLALGNADDPRALVDRLRAMAVEEQIDGVVVAVPQNDETLARRAIEALLVCPVDIYLWLDGAGAALARSGLLEGSDVPWLHVARRPVRDWGRIGKVLMDRLGAAFLLIGVAPLFLVVAILIKLDSRGPVFFRQLRYGYGRTPFLMWKFRTMYHNCDDPNGPFRQARKGDPRVTRVGRWLRRTSIDELPQLINVLRGEMSLVGPRPHAVAMDEGYERTIELYAARLRVRPGMTGWAQVNGCRGETDSEEKIRERIAYDLYYMRHWSLWFDVWILLLTIFRGFVNKNAY